MTAMIIDASGVRLASDALEVGKQIIAGRFFWLDISGGDLSARHAFLTEAGLNAVDAAWALRFGQTGRLHIGLQGLRVGLDRRPRRQSHRTPSRRPGKAHRDDLER